MENTPQEIWHADFPNFKHELLDASHSFVTILPPFNIDYGWSTYTCSSLDTSWASYFWHIKWSTVFEDGTTIDDDTYPTISTDGAGLGDDQKFLIDFEDPTLDYTGRMTVFLTAYLSDGYSSTQV